MLALKQLNLNIYTDNQNSRVTSPNPTTVASAIAGNNPLPTVSTLFVTQGLGPNGTANTMTTDIDAGIAVT